MSNATWWQRLFGMAQILLKPPDSFNFQTPDDWPQWIARFVQFRAAADLAADSDKKQVNTQLYCMGEGAAAVLASTNITVEERKDDPNIQRRLLAEPNLTLKKATEIAQALETTDRGAADLQSAQAVLVHSIEGENNASKEYALFGKID